ncbi:MAG: DUF2070 family protein [Candidatus Bathyarchaeia archaeon]
MGGKVLPSEGDESKILRHYRHLFRLPSLKIVMILHFILGLIYGALLVPEAFLDPPKILFYGIILMPFPTFFSDILIYFGFSKGSVLNLRRLSALSLFSNFLWLSFAAIGSFVSMISGHEGFLTSMQALAFSGTLCLRFIVFSALVNGSVPSPKSLISAAFHPLLCLTSLGTLLGLPTSFLIKVLIASIFLLLSTNLVLQRVDGEGRKRLGVGSLRLFSSFAANWMEDRNEPLEDIFESLGVETDVQVKLLAFGNEDRPFSILLIPYLHSGPFKNVGGSALPAIVSHALEVSVGRAGDEVRVLVFHGPSGHEMNPTSQRQSFKLIYELRSQAHFSFSQARVSRAIRASWGSGKALCQAFNDIALVILTLAPRNMEDLPSTIAEEINMCGKELGFDEVFVVDAHNSTSGSPNPLTPEEIDCVRKAALEALKLVSKEPRFQPKIGVSKVIPKGFTVSEGMGPGGISTFVVSVADQTAAYITVDGNNMITGLREKIISRIREEVEGVEDAEVTTTDTHIVNATITGRGYHPVGEAIDQEAFISWVLTGIKEALKNRRDAFVAWKSVTIKDIKVLGKDALRGFIEAIDASISTFRHLSLLLYPSIAITLMVLFSLL